MTEFFIFVILPFLIAMIALQSRFFHNWCFLLISALSIYFSLWTFPLLYGIFKDFYPKELQSYSTLITLIGTTAAGLLILQKITGNLASHSGGGYHLPKSKALLTFIPSALTGLLYAGFAGYLICVSPLHWKLVKTETFARKAVRSMLTFTTVMDRLSLQKYTSLQRKQALEKKLFPLEDPAVVAEQKAARIRAEKEAAEKAAAEKKAAEEKRAAEEAQQAAKKKKSGRAYTRYSSGRSGSSFRTPDTKISANSKADPQEKKVNSIPAPAKQTISNR